MRHLLIGTIIRQFTPYFLTRTSEKPDPHLALHLGAVHPNGGADLRRVAEVHAQVTTAQWFYSILIFSRSGLKSPS